MQKYKSLSSITDEIKLMVATTTRQQYLAWADLMRQIKKKTIQKQNNIVCGPDGKHGSVWDLKMHEN